MSSKATPTKSPPASQPDAERQREEKRFIAQYLLSPEAGAAMVINNYTSGTLYQREGYEVVQALDALEAHTEELTSSTPLALTERILQSQAMALNQLFVSLAGKAQSQNSLKGYETMLRLALKAQSQSRATLETLANIKQPRPVVIAQQANIASQQQVNNGIPPATAPKALNHEAGQPVPASRPKPRLKAVS